MIELLAKLYFFKTIRIINFIIYFELQKEKKDKREKLPTKTAIFIHHIIHHFYKHTFDFRVNIFLKINRFLRIIRSRFQGFLFLIPDYFAPIHSSAATQCPWLLSYNLVTSLIQFLLGLLHTTEEAVVWLGLAWLGLVFWLEPK